MNLKKRIVSAVLSGLTVVCALSGCSGTGETVTTADVTSGQPGDTAAGAVTAPEETAPPSVRPVIEDGKSVITVIRSTKADDVALKNVGYFLGRIKAVCGVRPSVLDDYARTADDIPADAPEILFGPTNRKPDDVYTEHGFVIRTEGQRIIIASGRSEYLRAAADYFVDVILNDPETAEVSDGRIVLKKDIDYVSEDSSYLHSVLSTDGTLEAVAEKLFTVRKPTEENKNIQGGWIDKEGKYFYQVFLQKDGDSNEAANDVRIVKYDIPEKKVVKVSGSLRLNHANDITWCPTKNCLAVVHNNPNRTHVSLVDKDTLELIETIDIGQQIYCMDYNEERNMYVTGVSGGQNFRFWDENFKAVNSRVFQATQLTNGYTTQGCATDGEYIYFVLYKQNVITVYDWNGKFVNLIPFDVGSIEPENISVVDGRIYVTCSQNGAAVFRITPIPASK